MLSIQHFERNNVPTKFPVYLSTIMSSSEYRRILQPRKNPERTCRTIAEVLAELNRPTPQERGSTKGNPKATSEPHYSPGATPVKPLPEKQQTQADQTEISALSACLELRTQTGPTHGNLSSSVKDNELLVPRQTATCLMKPKIQQKGRWRKRNVPSKKRVSLSTRSDVCNERSSERLDSARAVDCDDSAEIKETAPKKAKLKRSCAHRSSAVDAQALVKTSSPIHTSSTLSTSPKLEAASVSPSNSALDPCTPKRSRRRAKQCFISTPLTSTPLPPTIPVITEGGHVINYNQSELNMCPVKSSLSGVLTPKRGGHQKPRGPRTSVAQQKRKKEEQQDLCTAVYSKRVRKKTSAELLQNSPSQPHRHVRPRFELQDFASHEPEQPLPSDLSIKLSVQEEEPYPLDLSLSLQEDEEEEEDEELPSFLQQISQKPSLIREGLLVWCKLRKYPFWPAMVKSVNHKNKKASIVFIDGLLFDKRTVKKGFSVSLRTLKPFDCEDSEHFVDLAKEKYGDIITWCLDLISDYRIRIGCGSFVGSFIEYFDDDISCPVRNKYRKVSSSELTFPSQELLNEQSKGLDTCAGEDKEDKSQSKQEELHLKKVLPDRTLAARNRANERLVDFIVKKRGVENRLLAVISGQEPSKWRQALCSSSRPVVDVYLEDDVQQDKVYCYLEELCKTSPELETTDHISFALDVLLPEALIYAIAGVDHLSLEQAEAKYRRGPCHSNRERQEFDMMIEQQMKLKAAGPST
ncbi:uncharacterized protein LOC143475723 [Brachyhypopomus gauderio]|uniref:uncharacterized protein LOC143475723 n=1 Tax=Brachyhypopomus gauderio TaxID=698409 RepID=UPI004040EADA